MKLASNEDRISGKATLTTVMSSISINALMDVMASVHARPEVEGVVCRDVGVVVGAVMSGPIVKYL